ncbi:aspartate--tRNA ligase [Candidatus Mycoplasma haematominutum]|uniref:Aspartyl-tRNA synthetase n=1 Tax=Candidatus Mycoplasma haematominutum 'Birmingham 1' TaxID=1116213 RepID=G8C2V9_9MOLU|nr:aspartate--tRNA ligase [Candidatus Mycoplasma haematominutum]CCE66657.1 aspartyl-tRNA synthetase [Candidatus Mycoplasma haematominutum 'Birmingham 1']
MLSGKIPIDKVREFNTQKIVIGGFVEHVRKLKNIAFVIVRDCTSSIQVVFPKDKLIPLSKESVVFIEGVASKKRGEENYEIFGESIQVLSRAEKAIPIDLGEEKVSEERHRMKYRYLDLRRKKIKNSIVFNSRAKFIASSFLHSLDFIEITTPILSFPSKEGAQTFSTLPNSVSPSSFTLAQSPQMYKQLLMIGGFEKYFQFSTSFRAEKLREDRQFEFTQLDIELSFSARKEIFELIENLINKICSELLPKVAIPKNFSVITYRDAIWKYGTDSPDLRNPIEIFELYEKVGDSLKSGEYCFCILLDNSYQLTSEFFAKLDSNINWIQTNDKGKREGNYEEWILSYLNKLNFSRDKTLLYLASDDKNYISQLRKLGELRKVIWEQSAVFTMSRELKFVWIVEWPYFELSDTKELKVMHHPFTLPNIPEEVKEDHLKWNSCGYDLVLNGVEIASGGERITDRNLQKRIFQLLGLTDVQIQENFGWFLEALQYGVPPHLGIAIGWERFIQTILHLSSIRDVIAFPKNSHGVCSMSSYKPVN